MLYYIRKLFAFCCRHLTHCYCYIHYIAGTPYQGLKSEQLKKLVQKARRGEYDSWEGVISSHPLVTCRDGDERLFLLFNTTVNVEQKLSKMVGFGHPDLIHKLKHGPVHLFIDCTFACVPKDFSQCLVVMGHDKATSMYVPIFYVLLQSKKEKVYKHALQMCMAAADDQVQVINTTCDFEKGLMNAAKTELRAPVIGCEFHWKQAMRRKLLELGVPKDTISNLMNSDGLINLLTGIPIDEVEPKGIPYIRASFDEGAHVHKFNAFWKYFKETWMSQYDPRVWNVFASLHNAEDNVEARILNRTNNPLERFNRKFKSHFPARHPTMVQFVTAIKKMSNDYVDEIGRIQRGTSSAPVHKAVTVHEIPVDYAAFEPIETGGSPNIYSLLGKYRFLVNTTHYDPDDQLMFKVTKIGVWQGHIVAHRIQCKYQIGYEKDDIEEDYISVEEALAYSGYDKDLLSSRPMSTSGTADALDDTLEPRRKRSRITDAACSSQAPPMHVHKTSESLVQRVHCNCIKRSGQGEYCLAKQQRASGRALTYPNKMYWSCSKSRDNVSC